MEQLYPHVFEPITIRGVTFKNRLIMTPSSPGLADENGFVTTELIDFFRPIARGGAGVITMGNAPVNWAESHDEERQINLDNDEIILPLGRFADMCNQYGCEASVEINHTGLDACYDRTGVIPVGPSPCWSDMDKLYAMMNGREPVYCRGLTNEEVYKTIQLYIDAAVRCKKAGLKRVMVHGGHANLIGQFASPHYNHRDDEFGGSLENRARFATMILDGIRKACGEKDFVIEYRVSADEMIEDGMHFEETKELLQMLSDKIDIVNVSRGVRSRVELMRYWISPYAEPRMGNVPYARELRQVLPENVKVATVAGIMNIDNAEEILANGWADFVCMTRPFYADPEMPKKYCTGHKDDVTPCLRCNYCSTRLMAHKTTWCAVNPMLGRTTEYPLGKMTKADEKKRIAVIGGGPAGLQAMHTLIEKGYDVTLYEKTDKLGGNLNFAVGIQPLKQDLKAYLEHIVYKAQKAEKAGQVKILMNTEATPEMIEKENYDGLVIAPGADPLIPGSIPGIDRPNVHWAPLAELGQVEVGKRVVIIGTGAVGMESALGLSEAGHEVTVIDMVPDMSNARGGLGVSFMPIMDRLAAQNVQIKLSHKLMEITETGLKAEDVTTGETVEIPCDTVLLAMGLRPRKDIANALRTCVPATEAIIVGDAKAVGTVATATHTAFDAACYL